MMVIVNNLIILYTISGNTHVVVLAHLRETRKTKVHKDLVANLILLALRTDEKIENTHIINMNNSEYHSNR
ncbi:unnamed protein product [Caenorhabditis nigoni]